MNAIPAAARPAQLDADRQTRLNAAKKRRQAARYKPFKFVVLTLGVWWLLSVLADVVITCAPGGPPCRVPQLIVGARQHVQNIRNGTVQISEGAATEALSKYEWPLLLLSLAAALWVAKAKVYPDTDATAEFSEDELDGKDAA